MISEPGNVVLFNLEIRNGYIDPSAVVCPLVSSSYALAGSCSSSRVLLPALAAPGCRARCLRHQGIVSLCLRVPSVELSWLVHRVVARCIGRHNRWFRRSPQHRGEVSCSVPLVSSFHPRFVPPAFAAPAAVLGVYGSSGRGVRRLVCSCACTRTDPRFCPSCSRRPAVLGVYGSSGRECGARLISRALVCRHSPRVRRPVPWPSNFNGWRHNRRFNIHHNTAG